MRRTPVEQIGPQSIGRSTGRSSDRVHHARILDHANMPARLTRAKAEIDVLTVEAVAFIERASRIPHFAAKGQGRAAHPIDLGAKLPASTEVASEMSGATDHADHPRQRRRRTAAPLRSAVGVHEPRSRDAEGWVGVECGKESGKSTAFHDRIAVEQEDDASRRCADSSIRSGREAAVRFQPNDAHRRHLDREQFRRAVGRTIVRHDDLGVRRHRRQHRAAAVQRHLRGVERRNDDGKSNHADIIARMPFSLRATIGLAIAGQLFVMLGIVGFLRPWTIAVIALGLLLVEARRLRLSAPPREIVLLGVLLIPLTILALYPPIAFDETLYHLPFVRAIAQSGAINFFTDIRFPVFPQLHELLCVPLFLLFGDTATHFVAVAELLLLAGLLVAWPEQRIAGILAAALVLGNPIVIQLGTVTHVEMALTLFVAAGFYCLDRNPAAGGFLLGTACSVKYLGWYFAAAGVVYLLLFGADRKRTLPIYVATFAVAVLPMYGRIVALTGNPFFPFLPKIFGRSPWAMTLPTHPAANALRLFWDITFDRARVNWQPPYSPLFAIALLLTLVAATRDRRAAFLAAVCAGYIAIFTFLPQDSRYLLPLLPLVSAAAAISIAPLLRRKMMIALSLLSIAPGIAYAGYRIARQGPPPVTSAQRQLYLEARLPELRALEHRGAGRIYVCGAEQLKYFGGDDLYGDVTGPFANQRIFGASRNAAELSRALENMHVRYLLISRAHCPAACQQLPREPLFKRVYADGGAELWKVRR